MTIQQAIQETIANLLNATFTAENNGGTTVLKFNGDSIFYLG